MGHVQEPFVSRLVGCLDGRLDGLSIQVLVGESSVPRTVPMASRSGFVLMLMGPVSEYQLPLKALKFLFCLRNDLLINVFNTGDHSV